MYRAYIQTQRNFCFIILLLLLHQLSLFAQQEDAFSHNIKFSQNFNYYNWKYNIVISEKVGDGGVLLLTENFNSSLLKIRENEKKWKDDQRLNLQYSKKFSSQWVGKMLVSSLLFSDKVTGISNDIATNSASLGLQYIPGNFFFLASNLGYKFDKRFDILDHGPTYNFGLRVPTLEMNEYINHFGMSVSGDEFDSRKNRDLNIQYQVSRQFYEDTSDSLSVTFSRRRTDNYDLWNLEEKNIERLDEDLGTFLNILDYKINRSLKFRIESRVSARRTEVSRLKNVGRSKKDFITSNEITLHFNSNPVSDVLKLIYSSESQKNDIPDSLRNLPFSSRFSYVSPDFDVSRISLLNNLNLHISSRDTLRTYFSISKFQYDTPEEANFDDRDELRLSTSLQAIHNFGRFLKLKVNLGVNLKHLVYIYGEKSADNNWMRIFTLKPQLIYRPGRRLKLSQSFEVLANYVDYDFEKSSNPVDVRSFVYRKFTFQNGLMYTWSSNSTLNLGYRLELEENGKLFWDRWTEVIITTRENHHCFANVEYAFFPNATIAPGMVLFMRNEDLNYIENKENNRSNDYISYGPSLKIRYAPHPKLHFLFTGTRRTIDRVNQKSYYINNIHLNLMWTL